MKINRPLVVQKTLRLLKGHKKVEDLSSKQWELCSQETTTSPPAIALDGMLDRVKDVAEWTDFNFEKLRVLGGERTHRATIAYELRNISLIDGHLYKEGMRYPITPKSEAFWIDGPVEAISNVALASTWLGSLFFGHWLREDIPLTILATQLGEAITIKRDPYFHESGYRKIFNSSSRSVKYAKVDEIIVIDDIGQNSLKRKRYEELRLCVKSMETLQEKPVGVFIRRGKTGSSRQLLNSNEVEEFLSGIGFRIIEPEKMEPIEIVHQMKGAKIVVAVEGSNLVHAYNTLADDGTILVIQPPHRFSNATKDYTDCVGLNYAFLVAREGSNPSEFSVDIAELERTLEKIDRLTS